MADTTVIDTRAIQHMRNRMPGIVNPVFGPQPVRIASLSKIGCESLGEITLTHTCGIEDNRLLVVLIGGNYQTYYDRRTTYGDVPLTRFGSYYGSDNGEANEIWYLANPSSGSHTISFLGYLNCVECIAIEFTGADQLYPLSNYDYTLEVLNNAATTTAQVDVNDMLIGWTHYWNNGDTGPGEIAVTSPETEYTLLGYCTSDGAWHTKAIGVYGPGLIDISWDNTRTDRNLLAACVIVNAYNTALLPTPVQQNSVPTALGSDNNGTYFELEHTVLEGCNRCLLLGAGGDIDIEISSATFDGDSFTKISHYHSIAGANASVELWYLLAPSVGTYNIIINTIRNSQSGIGAVCFNNVDQAAPYTNLTTLTYDTSEWAAHIDITSKKGSVAFANAGHANQINLNVGAIAWYHSRGHSTWEHCSSSGFAPGISGSSSFLDWKSIDGNGTDWAIMGISLNNSVIPYTRAETEFAAIIKAANGICVEKKVDSIQHMRRRNPGRINLGIEDAWKPIDVASAEIVVWLDSRNIPGAVNNDVITTWEDSGGGGYDFTQTTEAYRPIFKTNIINGYPALWFDDTDDYLVSTYAPHNINPFTFFVVCKGSSGNTGDVINSGGWWNLRYTNSAAWGYYFGPEQYFTNFSPYNACVVCYHVDAAHVGEFRVNNTVLSSRNDYWGPNEPMSIGRTDLGNPIGGWVAEVLMYESDLNTTDIDRIEKYLGNKYGIF